MQQPLHNPALPTAADVDAAAQRLAGIALRMPLVTSPVLDALTGARIFLKAETLQRTGSFKNIRAPVSASSTGEVTSGACAGNARQSLRGGIDVSGGRPEPGCGMAAASQRR